MGRMKAFEQRYPGSTQIAIFVRIAREEAVGVR
jgi:hypothetical protein